MPGGISRASCAKGKWADPGSAGDEPVPGRSLYCSAENWGLTPISSYFLRETAYHRIFEIVEPIEKRPNLTAHYLALHGQKLG